MEAAPKLNLQPSPGVGCGDLKQGVWQEINHWGPWKPSLKDPRQQRSLEGLGRDGFVQLKSWHL